MNQRLTEIYRQCRSQEALASQDQYASANVLLADEVEKFAELIVRKCADLCTNPLDTEDILEYFGVAPD